MAQQKVFRLFQPPLKGLSRRQQNPPIVAEKVQLRSQTKAKTPRGEPSLRQRFKNIGIYSREVLLVAIIQIGSLSLPTADLLQHGSSTKQKDGNPKPPFTTSRPPQPRSATLTHPPAASPSTPALGLTQLHTKPRPASNPPKWYNQLLEAMSSNGSASGVWESIGSVEEGGSPRKQSTYVPGERSGKWSDEEHMKYIVFIDFNKERMRSKEKRRSNRFYEEMARFVGTRNALQCRSHHQKLQQKYTHVNKIIHLFRNAFSRQDYRHALERLQLAPTSTPTLHSEPSITTCDAAVQTDLSALHCDFVMESANVVHIYPPDMYSQHCLGYPMYTPPYGLHEMSTHSPPHPAYYPSPVGWWTAR